MTVRLPTPAPGIDAAIEFVGEHFAGLFDGPLAASGRFRGGQRAADAALDAFDVAGYARQRNEVLPHSARGASGLSPYIRHGLLPLRRVWDHVGVDAAIDPDGAVDGGRSSGTSGGDVAKFRDELLWQEFARHWYARLGMRTTAGVRRELDAGADDTVVPGVDGWDRSMRCVDVTLAELESDGWLVNQTRMWLASDWSIRRGWRWRDGEDVFFSHLLDGSRAANRLGWQWTTGVGSSKHYGFSRWQVAKRAPSLCAECVHSSACPIESWPSDPELVAVDPPASLRRASGPTLVGPASVVTGAGPEAVWLTAESLGHADPAAAAHPELGVVFVFDRPLLERLRLSAKRLVFLVETLAEWAAIRPVELWLGSPAESLEGRRVAVTHAPVPGFARHADRIHPVEVHPWPWLARPSTGSVASFSAWRRSVSIERATNPAR
jgi:deoxyribodipyrimidine photo-lyase